MGKKGKAIHQLNDIFNQDLCNYGHEKSWSSGKSAKEEINKLQEKVYGKDPKYKYKRTPKYDPLRGSGGSEGYGKLLNDLLN